MDDLTYQRKIEAIPHLNLTPFLPPVPLESIRYELSKNMHHISKFDYSRAVPSARIEFLKETWQGFSLVDITKTGAHMIDYYTTNLTHDKIRALGVEMADERYAKFQITDIGRDMPVTTAYTTSLFQDLCRIRVSRLHEKREIKYHCHQAKARQNPNKIVPDDSYRATLHIPIITNDQCYFAVTKDTGFDGHPDDFVIKDGELEFNQYYGLNEVWMFNSVHYHKAVNDGPTPRFHLLIYFDFMDAKIRPVIEHAIEAYTGPLIE